MPAGEICGFARVGGHQFLQLCLFLAAFPILCSFFSQIIAVKSALLTLPLARVARFCVGKGGIFRGKYLALVDKLRGNRPQFVSRIVFVRSKTAVASSRGPPRKGKC